MSAKGKVELVLAADDSKAIQAASKLLEKIREIGPEMDKTGRKQKSMLDELAGGATKFVTQLGTVTGATKLITDALDQVKQRIDAITAAQAKSAEVSKSYGEALGRVTVNMPGVSTEELGRVDAMLREITSRNALGEGGLIKLTDAYAQIQSAIPLATEATKRESLEQTAKLMNLVPTENASSVALGVAKILEAGGGTLNGDQALNLLRTQQTLGLVKDVGPIGQGIPTLASAARTAEVGLPDMQALAAYLTQAMGDTGGIETISAISGMTSKIMTRGTTIRDKLGVATEISGNLFQRLEQIAGVYQSGKLSEEEIGELLPNLTRSEKGKMAALELLRDTSVLNKYRSMMTDVVNYQGSLTDQDLATVMQVAPAQEFQMRRRQAEGQLETKRAGDAGSAQDVFYREEFEREIKARRFGDKYVSRAMEAYESRRYLGDDEQSARAFARSVAGLGRVPLVGGLMAGAATGEAQAQGYARDLTGYRGGNVVDLLYRFLSGSMAPRRPLKDESAR